MKCWLPILALAISAVSWAPPGAHAGRSREERAAALFASAVRRIGQGTHEQRVFARSELLEATALDPTRSDIELALGQLFFEGDLLRSARVLARRLTARDSTNAAAWLFEGRIWRRYWLATVDAGARDHAVVCLARCARFAPGEPGAWMLLSPLLADANELEPAYDTAVLAVRAAPGNPEARVLLAAAAQRLGNLESADRLFRAAIPALPAQEREHFDDITPLLPPWLAAKFVALDASARERYVETFWAENDPDPISAENEARLEFWARVTQATALYGTSRPGEWDLRAQYYVRFGRPEGQQLNPVAVKPRTAGDQLEWLYPDFGLRLLMSASSSFAGFSAPTSASGWALVPADTLARHAEWHGVNRGWAVFHKLPPGVEPLDARLALAQFQSAAGASVLAQVEATGGLAARLAVEWVVLDSTSTPVIREGRAMSASACRAEQARSASFTSTLSPGRYSIGVQVSDGAGRRGSIRRNVLVSPAPDELAISSLVVTCSPPERSVVAGSAVRLEPKTDLFPAGGDQLYAYFEIYNLAPSPSGDARFAYDCTVRTAERDRRGWLSRTLMPRDTPPPIQVSRAETTRGSLRRQFLSVPVGSLPAGHYVVEVVVHDVANGAEAKSVASFERQP